MSHCNNDVKNSDNLQASKRGEGGIGIWQTFRDLSGQAPVIAATINGWLLQADLSIVCYAVYIDINFFTSQEIEITCGELSRTLQKCIIGLQH